MLSLCSWQRVRIFVFHSWVYPCVLRRLTLPLPGGKVKDEGEETWKQYQQPPHKLGCNDTTQRENKRGSHTAAEDLYDELTPPFGSKGMNRKSGISILLKLGSFCLRTRRSEELPATSQPVSRSAELSPRAARPGPHRCVRGLPSQLQHPPGRQGGRLPNVLRYPSSFFLPCFQTGFPSCWMWFKTNPPPRWPLGARPRGVWGPPPAPRAARGSPAPVASGVPHRGAQGLSRSRRVSGSRRPQRDQKPVGGWPQGRPGRPSRSGSPRFSGEGADAAAGGGGPGGACAPGLPQPDAEPVQGRTEALRSKELPPQGWGRAGPGQGAWRDVEGTGAGDPRPPPPRPSLSFPV